MNRGRKRKTRQIRVEDNKGKLKGAQTGITQKITQKTGNKARPHNTGITQTMTGFFHSISMFYFKVVFFFT